MLKQSHYFGTTRLFTLPPPSTPKAARSLYFVNARMILADICRKKIDAMKDSDSTRTMNGSTLNPSESSV